MRKLRALTLAALLLTAPLVHADPPRSHPPGDRGGIIERLVASLAGFITILEDSVLSIPNG